jgi:glycosyltransferase involved in cell wall biosynthesis
MGGAEMVACKLQEKLRDSGIDAEIVRVADKFLPIMRKPWQERSVLEDIGIRALEPADVWLNFAETSLRRLDHDLLFTLHWNTIYLRHRNLLSYFLSHDRPAYDMYEHAMRSQSVFGKVPHAVTSYSRRVVDRDIIRRIRKGGIRLFAISQHVARRLETYWNVKPRRIIYPGGYDASFYDDSRDYVLYFGRLNWNQKRISLVYSTARMLPHVQFVLAGGPVFEGVDSRVLAPPANVRLELFDGLCPKQKKVKIYSQASCVLFPSLDEDFGIVPIEAMSAGKPCVVCTDGGGVIETVIHGKTGMIVDPNPRALAAAVTELHQRGLTMKKNCQERAREFSWDRTLNELSSEIRRCL